MPARICYVIGAGGHGKVVLSLLHQLGFEVPTVFDDDPNRWETRLHGIPVAGPISSVRDVAGAPGILAIGDNRTRQRIAQQYVMDWQTLIHPTAFVDESVSLGKGAVVLPNATVQVGTTVGDHVIVNSAATVEHDCTLGSFVHVAPGSCLAGSTTIDEGALLGIGSVTNVCTRVGAWACVGAGAVVIKDIPPNCVAVGVPARPLTRSESLENE